jgi:asparagine synthase (glutamine-hydrolysing)
MCGICGVASLEGPLDPAVGASVQAMADLLVHRGPDSQGLHAFDTAVLGFRRLAIIDRAGGSQPMSNEDGTCWIVFNGEIYNHHDLRRDLEAKGHRFKTHSDTEAIVHAWEEYGPSAVERLEGMFAFAIHDERRRTTFIARDRLGKKPLFYATLGGVLHFASELPALRVSPRWDDTLDLTSLEGYLSLGYFLAPGTIFRAARKLPPAHWLLLKDGAIEIRRYWDVQEFDTDTRRDGALIEAVGNELGAAVRARLESEVPLGAFLSGGIDSGLIVSYMAETLGDRLVTTSVGFDQAEHNELDAARLTARHCHARHYEETIQPQLDEVLVAATTGPGEPLADSSTIPTWYVSRSARAHVTVALSGDGGDETFAGYDFRYVPHVVEERARRLALGVPGRRLAGWLGDAWPRSPSLPRPLRLGSLLRNMARDPAAAYFVDLSFLKPDRARRLVGGPTLTDPVESPVYSAVTDVYRRCPSSHALTRAQYADLHVYLPNDPLVKVDRMSMWHSLEVRSPLLDRRVVELAFRIPASKRQRGTTGKWLLRKLASERLPAELASLPKRGFTAPVASWLAGAGATRFRDEVLAPDARVTALLDQSCLRRWFDQHRAGGADHSYALWASWVLERWLREFAAPAAASMGAWAHGRIGA